MPKQFWVKRTNGNLGPFTGSQIRQLFTDGKLTPDDEISQDGMKWQTLASVLEYEKQAKPKQQAGRSAAAKRKPPKPQPAAEAYDDLDVIDDFEELEEDDDEIEDYGDVEFGDYGAPATPHRSSRKSSRGSRKRKGGSWGGAYAGLSVFHYSFIALATVAVSSACSVFAAIPAGFAVAMVRLGVFSRESADAAFYLGDFILLIICFVFVQVISSVRGEIAWWGYVAAAYTLGVGFLLNPFVDDQLRNIVSMIFGLVLAGGMIVALVASVALLVGWLMSLSVPAESGLRKHVAAGVICLCLPVGLVLYARFGGSRSPLLLLFLLLLQIVAAIGVFVTFAMYLRGIGRHFKNRSLVDAVDGYVSQTLIAILASIALFLIVFAVPNDIAAKVRPIFLLGFLFVGPYLSILLVEAVGRARDAVH